MAEPEDRSEEKPQPLTERRLALRVTRDAQRQVRGGHPWVYAESITAGFDHGRAGDLAVIFDDRRRFLAIGLYDPDSPIRIKVLHAGAPRTIDQTFLAERLAAAVERRAPLAADPDTTAYRCVHGENDALPGLVLDRYENVAVLKLYSAAWLPHLAVVVALISAKLAPRAVVLRLSRSVSTSAGRFADGVHDARLGDRFDGEVLIGTLPSPEVLYHENGLAFGADVVRGQKTGAFLDQRDNRQRIRGLSAGARVLDVFCCTGGFTVHAAAGGALAVHSVDRSAPAVAAAQRAMQRNGDQAAVRACAHTVAVNDAEVEMALLRAAGRRFDVIVVDPPAFAVRARQVTAALRSYRRLADLAMGLLAPGGTLLHASCSSRVHADDLRLLVADAAAAAGKQIVDMAMHGQPLDHPVGFAQGAYLDAVLVRTR